MSTNIKLKRSSVAGNKPSTSQISLGELAINTADGAIYSKKSDNTIFAIHDDDILQLDDSTNNVNRVKIFETVKRDSNNEPYSTGSESGFEFKEAIGLITDQDEGFIEVYKTDESVSPKIRITGIQLRSAGTSYIRDRLKVGSAGAAVATLEIGSPFGNLFSRMYGYNSSATAGQEVKPLLDFNQIKNSTTSANSSSEIKMYTSTDGTQSTTIYLSGDADTTSVMNTDLNIVGKTNISRLDSRLKTPDGDNSISDIPTFGKFIKIATIDVGAVGEYYRVNLDMYLTGDGVGKPVRSYVSIQQDDAFGNNPERVIFNISDDDRDVTETKYPEILIRYDNDASSGNDGSGPTRVELWVKIRTEGSGVEVFVKDEVFSSSDVTATWITSYAVTDYVNVTGYGSSGLPNGNNGTVAHGHSTRSENWDSLFGSNPGVAITNGGKTRSDISVITPGEGFLRNDGGASGGTYSYTYDMVPEAASTTLTIGRTDQDATGVITLGRSTATNTINIGNAATANAATQTINIGGGKPSGGSVALNLGANTNASANTSVTIGNNNRLGTHSVAVRGNSTFSNGSFVVDPTTTSGDSLPAKVVTIGSTDQEGTITLGQSTATNTINIGNAVTADGETQTINIGGGNASGGDTILNLAANTNTAADTTVTIGSNNTTGTMTVAIRGTTTFSNGTVNTTHQNTGTVVEMTDGIQLAESIGWVPYAGSNDKSRLAWDQDKGALAFTLSGSATMGVLYKAIKVYAGQKVHISLSNRSSTTGPSGGTYAEIYQYDGSSLPNGKTHVGDTSSMGAASAYVQDDNTTPTNIITNAAAVTTFTNNTHEYVPSADGYMSIGFYFTTAMGTTVQYIKEPKITNAGLSRMEALAVQYIFG